MNNNNTLGDSFNTSYEELNFVEKAWLNYFNSFENETIATALIAFLIHEIVYFGRCIPFIIADFIPSFTKYKLQPNKVNTAAEQWSCLKSVLASHFLMELPLIFGFHPIATLFGMDITTVPFPHWQTMSYQIALFFVMEDTFHYWFHRLLHYGPFYKYIHKKHHEYSAPFGLAAEYAHPLEVLILGAGTIGGPLLWVSITHNLHLITVFIWISLRLFQAIDAHSGYDFPWSLRHFLPFWAGAEHHDYHHMAFVNCFSTSFRWWDHLMGTDLKYQAYRQKKADELKAVAAGGSTIASSSDNKKTN
ncbi:C-4 sterol methyl oxidase [Glomus cerebriforme]|uniref:C-4 sterol methyl oxidase n=1 Tax=Glomus cerebriforme TaxID=658196 RepID=A0A397TDU3_9GLOM|nr:C-4 sterol methyl oxidase [Glomus cerebriforme]